MANTVDPFALEKALASREARKLRASFKSAIKETVNVTNFGNAKKATVRTKFKYQRLDRITFVAPDYVYMQHNGFEGVKSNGVSMRLKATNVLNKALLKSNTLVNIVDGLAEIRMEEVFAKFNFELKA